jgi:BMFP domain-containing protein YqiC
MKIGIVSAQKHCKTHLRQLKSDGHDVVCLGARPRQIPPSYDALIVRIASMRHCDSYKEWARDTGRPVIYEDGLSGIRRELDRITPTAPESATLATSAQEVRVRMLEWGTALVEARPQDNHNTIAKHLTDTLREQFPSLSSEAKTLVNSVLAELFRTTIPPLNPHKIRAESYSRITDHEKTMPNRSNTPSSIELLPYVGSPALWPTDTGWAEKYTEPKVQAAYKEAVSIITLSGVSTASPFVSGLMSGILDPKVKAKWKKLLHGKPLPAAFVLYMLAPTMTKKQGGQAYRLITGKGIDGRLKDVVEWALGNWGPVVEDTVLPGPEKAEDSRVVTDNTKAILEVMDDLAAFKKEIRASIEAKVKVLDDSHREVFKVLQNFSSESGAEHLAVESRIKGLELAGANALREVHYIRDAAIESVDTMREDLRGDIANAFDALAAEQQTPVSGDLSSNPFAALEQVKAALKAAGFKGTLTLTIE